MIVHSQPLTSSLTRSSAADDIQKEGSNKSPPCGFDSISTPVNALDPSATQTHFEGIVIDLSSKIYEVQVNVQVLHCHKTIFPKIKIV